MKPTNIQNEPRRWWVLIAIAVSMLTVALDMTVLNLALPELAADLHASTSELQWFANAYNLVLAAALLPAGLLGDRYGRKKWLLFALALFGGASIACAYAGSAGMLIAGRAVLGLGAALMMPLTMSMLPVLFTDADRPKAMRIWVTASALGMPLGPIVGGWLLEHYSWGSVFLINVPVVIVAVIAIAWLMPESRGSDRSRVDYWGILTSSLVLAAVTYGVTQAGDRGWSDIATLGWLAAGVASFAGFFWRERAAKHPLVDLGFFRNRGFGWGASLATLVNFSMFGILFGLPLLFTAVNGVGAQASGMRLLPLMGGLMVGAQLSGKLLPRLGDKTVLAIGFALMAAGLGMGGLTDASSGYGYAAAWIALSGLGLGFTLPTAMDVATSALPAERSGIGSGLIMAMRQVGGTLGVALLGSVLNSIYRHRVALDGLNAEASRAVQDGVASGAAVAKQAGDAGLLASVRHAYVSGFDAMLWSCAGFALLGAVLALSFMPRKARAAQKELLEDGTRKASMH